MSEQKKQRATDSGKRVYALLHYSISRDAMASVHREGCRDVRRDQSEHGASVQLVRASTAARVVAYWLDPEMVEMGYTAQDIKVHNCAKD